MKAEELRIGNLVQIPGLDRNPFEIRSVSKDRVHPINVVDLDGYASDCRLENLEPIPLTEEWAERLGFDNPIVGNAWRLGKIAVIFWPTGSITVEFKNIEIKEINAVHELQNLIYTLAGQELTLTPQS